MSNLDRVREIAADVFGIAPERLTPQSGPESIEEWDSVQHLNLMLELESAFGITLTPEDMVSIHSIGEISAFVDHAAAKSA